MEILGNLKKKKAEGYTVVTNHNFGILFFHVLCTFDLLA